MVRCHAAGHGAPRQFDDKANDALAAHIAAQTQIIVDSKEWEALGELSLRKLRPSPPRFRNTFANNLIKLARDEDDASKSFESLSDLLAPQKRGLIP